MAETRLPSAMVALTGVAAHGAEARQRFEGEVRRQDDAIAAAHAREDDERIAAMWSRASTEEDVDPALLRAYISAGPAADPHREEARARLRALYAARIARHREESARPGVDPVLAAGALAVLEWLATREEREAGVAVRVILPDVDEVALDARVAELRPGMRIESLLGTFPRGGSTSESAQLAADRARAAASGPWDARFGPYAPAHHASAEGRPELVVAYDVEPSGAVFGLAWESRGTVPEEQRHYYAGLRYTFVVAIAVPDGTGQLRQVPGDWSVEIDTPDDFSVAERRGESLRGFEVYREMTSVALEALGPRLAAALGAEP
jgi:hypothetical protein